MADNTILNPGTGGDRSYVDAWQQGRRGLIDNRQPGFQVWISLASAVAALAGMDKDGSYTADQYPVFLLIRTREVHDSPGEWYAIYPEEWNGGSRTTKVGWFAGC